MRQRLHRFFNSATLTYWNAGLCVAAIVLNALYQVFCRPVTWASITLVVAILPVILYPKERDRLNRWRPTIFFLFGIAACICVYCILFLGLVNIGALPFALMGALVLLLAYLPHFLLLQIVFHVRHSTPSARRFFKAGVALCILTGSGMGAWFHLEHPAVEAAIADPEHHASAVEPSYMTERMLGMHFKYHTGLCLFDGWRPPLHDPLLVTAIWLNYPFMDSPTAAYFRRNLLRGGGPFFVMGPWDLKERVAVYKQVFPHKPLRQSCSCARAYADRYFADPLLQ